MKRAGHTGTLDPFATGLLPIVVGEAAKFARFLIDSDKGYEATLRLGYVSSTGDPEGEITEKGFNSPKLDAINAVLGDVRLLKEQYPPMHSAVRVGGRRLYELAREGVSIERAARSICINSIETLSYVGESLVISVNCSKGTYIRVLAEEIGARLGCGAYLTGLRRTATGPFRLEQATSLEDLERGGVGVARERLLPPEVLVGGLPQVKLAAAAATALSHGQRPFADAEAPAGEAAMFGPGGRFIGVARVESGAWEAVRLMGQPAPVAP